jgi:alkyldihydroxyacetonephosphate synthase
MKQRSFWGWGYEEEALGADERRGLGAMLSARIEMGGVRPLSPPSIDAIELAEPCLRVPAALAGIVRMDKRERAAHTYGKAYRDVVRGLAGDFGAAPDGVAYPESEADLSRLLEFCSDAGVAAIPYGGGSSVVGGVEARGRGPGQAALSIDLGKLDKVLEIDPRSRAARIQCGILGPALEEALRPHGLTLRHYPQSFEFSTLGGWIATRAGGHFATLHTHIDDFVESLRVVTPRGPLASRRLPGSGAGPSPDRLFLGSEGALGIITEAWMRLLERPRFRASATARFGDFYAAAEAARRLAQSGLHPSNCRVLDAAEAQNNGAGDGTEHLLLLAFESSHHPLDAWMARGVELCRDAGGRIDDAKIKIQGSLEGEREGAAGAWRSMFLRGPYLRDAIAQLGLVVETFETAITWDRFQPFCEAVRSSVTRALGSAGGILTCRLTHVYPDGAAPYFTVVAPGRPGALVEQWDAVKLAVSETIVAEGGTITHHHAVGRDHAPFYRKQRPPFFGEILAAAKAVLDPKGVMNPGVLV